jgi:hypothetical protein
MGDSPRSFDVYVKVNYLEWKLKRRSDRPSTARAEHRFMHGGLLQCGHRARNSAMR